MLIENDQKSYLADFVDLVFGETGLSVSLMEGHDEIVMLFTCALANLILIDYYLSVFKSIV